MKTPDSALSPSIPLADLRRGEAALVTGLASNAGFGAEADVLLARLRDLGFVAGAHCEVVARMWMGGDPVAVRVGGSTFALRRVEADAVRVRPLHPQPAHAALTGNASAATA